MLEAEAQWLVGRTRSRQERWAAHNCKRQGVETYLPVILERGVCGGRRTERRAPLFPGYLFIRTLQWRFLLGTFGLIDLIRYGDKPSVISQAVIDDLQRREANGMVCLPEATQYLFRDDDKVRVTDGPFAGHVGLVTGYTAVERVRVLLNLLGRKVPVLIAEQQLEPV